MNTILHPPSSILTPPTYPARPINGGPLPNARPKTGDWYYEPKYNGWRALVHVPTGTMFNREGKRLSINGEFRKALDFLGRTINVADFPDHAWLDCEALERRHGIGRGTLILLDYIPSPESHPSYRQRHDSLQGYCADGLIMYLAEPGRCEPDDVYLCPHIEDSGDGTPGGPFRMQVWEELQAANKRLGVEFFEGLVAKRADSLYPMQLRSPKEEFAGWMKHRWSY